MARGTLEIGFYEPPAPLDSARIESEAPTSHLAPVTALRLPSRSVSRYGVVGTGALASFLLHALLITSLTWGGSHVRPVPPPHPDLGAPSSRDESEGEFTMELVSIEKEAGSSAEGNEEAIVSPTFESVTLEAALANVSVPPMSDPDATHTELSEASAAARAALVGRYLGQINARIERAWRRPRTSVDAGPFSCRVRIEQDASGGVREITLERCNGDAHWQVSLVHAIQRASPLPAPPDPTVFTRVLRMNFRAQPYSPQAPQDAYEPALIAGTP